MDSVSGVSAASSLLDAAVLQPAATAQAIDTAVVKKTADAQATAALSLLQALPPVPQYNNPPHLGNTVSTKV